MQERGETINLFQLELASAVLGYGLSAGQEIEFRLGGESEVFVVAEIAGVRVHIYSDAFDVQSASYDIRFEADDLETIEMAKEAVVEALVSVSS